MRRAHTRLLALAAIALLAWVAAAAHGRGIHGRPPNMPAMAVLRSDLAPGAAPGHQGFSRPPRGFRAQYVRSFSGAQAPAGGPTFALACDLLLAHSEVVAARTVALQRTLYGSRAGHGLLEATLVTAIRHGHRHGGIGSARFGTPVGIEVGAGSFAVSASVTLGRVEAHAQFAELAAGPVAATLTFVAVGAEVPLATVSAIAGDVARHIAAVLTSSVPVGVSGVTGATPPTGTTATTGATAATGLFGTTGTTGATGLFGVTGATPPSGTSGASGATGLSGTTGATGPTPPTGA
jgi:hypothetical protein